MRLAKWFKQCLTITFQSFANEIKVSCRNAASEIYSEFIYLCWRLWSPCFSVFCQMKTIGWKLSFWKPNSFIVLSMHALSLNSKFLIRRNLFPAYLTTQIDQSSLADFVLHRPWKAPKKGFNTSLVLISSVTGVGVKFFVVEEKINLKLNMTTNSGPFFPCKFPYVHAMKRYLCYWYLSQWKAKLFITFVIARVPSSLVLG